MSVTVMDELDGIDEACPHRQKLPDPDDATGVDRAIEVVRAKHELLPIQWVARLCPSGRPIMRGLSAGDRTRAANQSTAHTLVSSGYTV